MGPMEAPASLQMGQSPGTQWYHAHKHGSTAINVANGMTGAFIIEGRYDDELNAFYGPDWTRTQPVMVINQLGVSSCCELSPGALRRRAVSRLPRAVGEDALRALGEWAQTEFGTLEAGFAETHCFDMRLFRFARG